MVTPKAAAPNRRAIEISTTGSSPTTPTRVTGTPRRLATHFIAWREGLPVRIIGAWVTRRIAPTMA